VVDQGGIEGTSYTAVGLTYNTLHYWRLVASGLGGASNWSDVWSFTTVGVTSVEEGIPSVPKAYVLSQSYPNPFNPTTTIQFELPQRGYVTLRVFDLLGKEVACLVSEALGPGSYKARWQADVPSGTYIYRLQAGEYVGTRKMVLVR
jgi:hypothetical protein